MPINAHEYSYSELFSPDSLGLFRVPVYQREYSWEKKHWQALFDDLNESDMGYFLGSIICISRGEDALRPILEVVDGQQRLISLGVFLSAIHSHLVDLTNTTAYEKETLRRMLYSEASTQPRFLPSEQGNNKDDYNWLVTRVWRSEVPNLNQQPRQARKRPIFKAFDFFRSKLAELEETEAHDLMGKLKSASMVKIEVPSARSAYALFNSVNNRGKPLSSMDIVKNELLADCPPNSLDQVFSRWCSMIDSIESADDQERFLRHSYNSMLLPRVEGIQTAKRSNLIVLYERLITANGAVALSNNLFRLCEHYALLRHPMDERLLAHTIFGMSSQTLLDLYRIEAAPAYALLLYLATIEYMDSNVFSEIVRSIVGFFFRRSLTDIPGTRKLDNMFFELVTDCEGKEPAVIRDLIRDRLRKVSASDEILQAALHGDIYEHRDAARFALTKIEEANRPPEQRVDLWERSLNTREDLLWTIEHILPKGENVPESWWGSLNAHSLDEAKELREPYIHKLGNLTLTVHNSELGNASFLDKRDRCDSQGRPIGYRNGLWINADLANRDEWTTKDIETRTELLAQLVLAAIPL